MFDDLFENLLSEVGLEVVPGGRRTRGCLRVFFGLLLAGLSLAGAWMTLSYDASLHFRAMGVLLFVALAAFGLVNVVFLRRARWAGRLVLLSFIGLFVVRILFGP